MHAHAVISFWDKVLESTEPLLMLHYFIKQLDNKTIIKPCKENDRSSEWD